MQLGGTPGSKQLPTPTSKKRPIAPARPAGPSVSKTPAAKPNTTTVTGARKETKFSPNSMYKIKNEYDSKGNLMSTDTSRTLKGKIFGAPKKGGSTSYKKGGSVKGKK
jgi:hypothetical protein